MNDDYIILTLILACLAIGGIFGVGLTYSWLMRNSNGVDDEDFYI